MSQEMFSRRIGVANAAATVTPSDATVLPPTTIEVYVGGTGDVAVMFWRDTAAVTFKAVPVGTVIRGNIQKVMATNTTATLMVVKYIV